MSRQDAQPPAGQSTDDDMIRQQRIAAMRELAGADVPAVGVSSGISSGVSSARRSRMRALRVSVALSVLVVIVLLVTVGAAWQGWLPWQRKQPAQRVC